MNLGHKLVMIGVVLLLYWIVAAYAREITIDQLILEQKERFPETVELKYPWWWPVVGVGDYAGSAGFIMVVVGFVKIYMIWKF